MGECLDALSKFLSLLFKVFEHVIAGGGGGEEDDGGGAYSF